MTVWMGRGLGLALLGLLFGGPAMAQTVKVAVIDSDRIVTQSTRGKAALEELKARQEQKRAAGAALQKEAEEIQRQITEGQLSLSPDRLEQLREDLERKAIDLRRFQDDAERELTALQEKKLGEIERDVIGVISTIGQELGYTLVFNKFRSGLVFADPAIDITDQVIQRFDAAYSP